MESKHDTVTSIDLPAEMGAAGKVLILSPCERSGEVADLLAVSDEFPMVATGELERGLALVRFADGERRWIAGKFIEPVEG